MAHANQPIHWDGTTARCLHQTPINPSDIQNWKVVRALPLVQGLLWVHALTLNGSEFHLVCCVNQKVGRAFQTVSAPWNIIFTENESSDILLNVDGWLHVVAVALLLLSFLHATMKMPPIHRTLSHHPPSLPIATRRSIFLEMEKWSGETFPAEKYECTYSFLFNHWYD